MGYYWDTFTFGGYYDSEFSYWTRKLLDRIIKLDYGLVYSYLVAKELENAPERVRNLIHKVSGRIIEFIGPNQDVIDLATVYIKKGALTKRFKEGAEHIALATICDIDVLVSWNFKHMVNLIKLKQYNSINLEYGYRQIDIRYSRELLP